MPIYEYRRPDGTTFELVQSFSDDPLTRDPDTGVPVERVLHPPAVHFKGKGFYNTDYGTRKRQRENAAAASDGSSESPTGKESSAEKGSSSENGSSSEKSPSGEKGSSADGSPKGKTPSKDAPKGKNAKPVPAGG